MDNDRRNKTGQIGRRPPQLIEPKTIVNQNMASILCASLPYVPVTFHRSALWYDSAWHIWYNCYSPFISLDVRITFAYKVLQWLINQSYFLGNSKTSSLKSVLFIGVISTMNRPFFFNVHITQPSISYYLCKFPASIHCMFATVDMHDKDEGITKTWFTKRK